MKYKQLNIFDEIKIENQWEEHYVDLPEYNNVKEKNPFIIATFKFRSQEDFDKFNKLIKQHLYNGEKVFDGMQRQNIKSSWYPLKEKASKYRFK